MKRALLAVCLGLAVSGCAGDYYGPGGYSSYGGLAYYDDFYGPYYDGYWGHDGFYYYSLGRNRPFIRDQSHHFRRDNGGGFHGVQGHQGGRWGGHWGGRAGDHQSGDHDQDHDRR